VVPVSVAISADVGQVVETAAEVGVAALLEGLDVPAAVLGELVEGAVVLDAPHAARSSTLKRPIPAAPGWRRVGEWKDTTCPPVRRVDPDDRPDLRVDGPVLRQPGLCPVGPAPWFPAHLAGATRP
jgi:hypothetical protein